MTTKQLRKGAFLGVVAVCFICSSVWAQPEKRRESAAESKTKITEKKIGARKSVREREIPQEIRLSDEQRLELRNIIFNSKRDRIMLMAKQKVARLELKEMMVRDDADRDLILQKLDEVSKLQHQLARQRLQQHLATRDLLTKEQREFFKQRFLKERIRQRWHYPGRLGPGPRIKGHRPPLRDRLGYLEPGGPMGTAPPEDFDYSETDGLMVQDSPDEIDYFEPDEFAPPPPDDSLEE